MERHKNIFATSHLTIKDEKANILFDEDFESVITINENEIIIESNTGFAVIEKELNQKTCLVLHGKDSCTGETIRFVTSNVNCVCICGRPANRVLIFE